MGGFILWNRVFYRWTTFDRIRLFSDGDKWERAPESALFLNVYLFCRSVWWTGLLWLSQVL